MVHINREGEVTLDFVILKKLFTTDVVTDYFNVYSTCHQKRAVETSGTQALLKSMRSAAMRTFKDCHRNCYSWFI